MVTANPFLVNMGPQHPSTHGVLRLRLVLDGEKVLNVEPVLGYLHSSKEKLQEEHTYLQTVPITDRMDYLAAMSNNLGVALAIEKLAGIEAPERAQYLRVIMAELQRVASHCFAQAVFLQDLGAWGGPLMYFLREREQVLDIFEMVCGARLTYNYIRPGGVSQDVPPEFLPAVHGFLATFPKKLDEYEGLLTKNEILRARTVGVGVISRELALSAGFSGPMLRGSGVDWDLRKQDPYCVYDRFAFDVPLGHVGDCYDRFMVRFYEIRESLRILHQALEQLPPGEWKTPVPIVIRPPAGEAFQLIESPRGMLGYYLVSDGGAAPWRFHVRAPSFLNLGALNEMLVGSTVADVVAIVGSIDIVMGEVDR
ncbi:MAG: NADH-quinone oxidoreductase subunit D [Dehalococcoidia bacterium]|nr:NADH-quinone oxidoreductase subunit D [Dehalococcoidia bacterium]